MKILALVSTAMGVGSMIGMYVALKLEDRYVLRPLNAYVDMCYKQCEKEMGKFKVVEDEGENE